MKSQIQFYLNNRRVEINAEEHPSLSPLTTVLQYLRSLPDHKSVKEGCAEGDCGACTVVLAKPNRKGKLEYRAVNSCLLFLPMLDGAQLLTVEDLLQPDNSPHPIQSALTNHHASQCGFCTPGIVMSLFALSKAEPNNGFTREDVEIALAGNLCRCTGYRPILDAAMEVLQTPVQDQFDAAEAATVQKLQEIPGESLHIRHPQCEYFRPATLVEAFNFLAAHPDCRILNGGSDAALEVTKQFKHFPAVLDLSNVDELRKVEERPEGWFIGAGVPMANLQSILPEKFSAIHHMLSVFASLQIRNVATIGGNLGTASPIGDMAPVLMAYRCRVQLSGPEGQREVPLDSFFTGYRQTVKSGMELITGIILPHSDPQWMVKAYKISRRKDVDISTLSGGFALKLNKDGLVEEVILAFGGMAATSKRARKVEEYLAGKSWNPETIEDALPFLQEDFTPISDVRGSARFRLMAAENLLRKFYLETSQSEELVNFN
ncbi:MAG: xanthine dehydrogenase small subunit [Calditrichia bacterium]